MTIHLIGMQAPATLAVSMWRPMRVRLSLRVTAGEVAIKCGVWTVSTPATTAARKTVAVVTGRMRTGALNSAGIDSETNNEKGRAMNVFKATFQTREVNCTPHDGQRGLAWRASGHYDPESVEFEAWLFQPKGDDNAYYCTSFELDFDKPAIPVTTPQ